MNLPGSQDYDPSLPWVSKVCLADGNQACDVFIYADDCRSTEPTYEECWQTTHVLGSQLNWLGLQDATCKQHPPLLEPGAWVGSVVHTSNGSVSVLVTQEHWDKARKIICWLQEASLTSDFIDRKTLESHRGFLVYLGCTYLAIVPYFKGIHLTIDSWWPWWKNDAWKMTQREIAAAMLEKGI